MKSKRAAVLGLGIIGSRATIRLQDAGWEVACWNRTPKGMPGETTTAEDAVKGASVISIYLKDAPAVRTVMERVLPAMEEGALVFNHATVDLETTLWLDEKCRAEGYRFLDAPFTGSKMASASGKLVYYTGGDPALVEEATEYLEATASSLLPCGPVGAATVVKLATNLVSACIVEGLAEGLAVAVKHGVPAEAFVEAVARNASASVLSGMKLPTMASGDYDTHFSLENMWKDSRYAIELANQAGLDTPAIRAVSERMEKLCGDGLGNLDYSALAKPYFTE